MLKLNKEEKREILQRISKGSNQYYVLEDLLENGKTEGLGSYITTNRYYSKYIASYQNAIDRLQKELNLNIKFNYGKNGGFYTGYYEIE